MNQEQTYGFCSQAIHIVQLIFHLSLVSQVLTCPRLLVPPGTLRRGVRHPYPHTTAEVPLLQPTSAPGLYLTQQSVLLPASQPSMSLPSNPHAAIWSSVTALGTSSTALPPVYNTSHLV